MIENFQLGDPVEHRGVVVCPLFPLADPRAQLPHARGGDSARPAHPGARLCRVGARAPRREPARRARAALRRRGARRSETEPDPQRQRARRRRRRSFRSPCPASSRGAGATWAWTSVPPRTQPIQSCGGGRPSRFGWSRSREASRRARSGTRCARRTCAWTCARGPAPARTRIAAGRSRFSSSSGRSRSSPGRPARCSRSATRSASTTSRGRTPSSGCIRSFCAGTCSMRWSGWIGLPGRTSAGFVAEIASAQGTRRPSAGLGEDLRLESAGVIGSGLELEGELLQLSGFTSGRERRTFGRIARPSRRA